MMMMMMKKKLKRVHTHTHIHRRYIDVSAPKKKRAILHLISFDLSRNLPKKGKKKKKERTSWSTLSYPLQNSSLQDEQQQVQQAPISEISIPPNTMMGI